MTGLPAHTPEYLTALRRQILARCNLEELRTLCADLGVRYDDLGGEGLEAKARELVDYMDRHGRLPDLERILAAPIAAQPAASTFHHAALSSLHQLTAPPADFVGRKAELAELLAQVERSGVAIIGLRGMGGIGKTALALKLAEQLTPRYPDAQLLVNLRGASPNPLPPGQAMAEIIRAFHPTALLPEQETELQKLYCSVLYGKKALLLLDDARDAGQVEPLLPPASCLLLVTSRQRFTLPGLRARDLDTLPPDDARALLLRIAERINGHADHIAKLCGYLPLALRLSASALAERATLSVAAYVERLQDAQKRLELVDASLSLSYDLLTPRLQQLWRALAVFPIGFDLPAAAAVWDLEPDAAQDALDALARCSLVDFLPSPASAASGGRAGDEGGRFSLHDLARVFADQRLAGDERAEAQYRHTRHYAGVVDAANNLIVGDSLLAGLAWLDTELEHIRRAIAWAAAQESQPAAQVLRDLVVPLRNYAIGARTMHREYGAWLDSALAACQTLHDKQGQANVLKAIGDVQNFRDDRDAALASYGQALSLFRAVGARLGQANVLKAIGDVQNFRDDRDAALASYGQALSLFRAVGDRLGQANVLLARGDLLRGEKNFESAWQEYTGALAGYQAVGDAYSCARVYYRQGNWHAEQSHWSEAIELYQQAAAIWQKIGLSNLVEQIIQPRLERAREHLV